MIYPSYDINRWSCCGSSVVLANAENYYTKCQVDDMIEDSSGVTEDKVNELISDAVDSISAVTIDNVQEIVDNAASGKADVSTVEELATQVANNASAILNRYTKDETDSLVEQYLANYNDALANYTTIDGDTLTLASNIS